MSRLARPEAWSSSLSPLQVSCLVVGGGASISSLTRARLTPALHEDKRMAAPSASLTERGRVRLPIRAAANNSLGLRSIAPGAYDRPLREHPTTRSSMAPLRTLHARTRARLKETIKSSFPASRFRRRGEGLHAGVDRRTARVSARPGRPEVIAIRAAWPKPPPPALPCWPSRGGVVAHLATLNARRRPGSRIASDSIDELPWAPAVAGVIKGGDRSPPTNRPSSQKYLNLWFG